MKIPNPKSQIENPSQKMKTALLLLLFVFLVSCKQEEETTPPRDTSGGYVYTIIEDEDTTVYRIPGDAVSFAQQHYSRDAQMLREYQVVRNVGGEWTQNPYPFTLSVWKSETWSVRRQYLVTPYANNVDTDDSAQFYYQIGGVPVQFGYGWNDTFNAASFDPDSAYTSHIWSEPVQTIGFDGESAALDEYVGLWIVE